MKTAGRKPNIAIYAACILLCLTLLSLYVTTGLYAKYISSDSASDSAHTAAFYIKADGSLLSRSFAIDDAIPGATMEKELQIVNKSEVKMKYTLTVRNETNNLPLSFHFTKEDTHEEFFSTDGVCVIEQTLAPGEGMDRYAMDIIWEVSDAAEDENLPFMGMVDSIVVTLEAVQVD